MYTSVMIVVMCLSSVSMQNINHNSITDQRSNVNQSKTLLESDNLFNLLETKILNIETINLEDKRLKRDVWYPLCHEISNVPKDSQLKLKYEIMKAHINVILKMSFLNEVPSDFCKSMMEKINHLTFIKRHQIISKINNIIEELKEEDGLSPKEDDYENSDNNVKNEYPDLFESHLIEKSSADDNRVIDNLDDDDQAHSNNGDIGDENNDKNKYNINLKNEEQSEGSLIQNNVEDRVNDFNNEEQSEGSLRQNNDEDRLISFKNEEQSEGSLRQNNDEDDNNNNKSLDEEPHIISRRKNKNRKKNKKRPQKNKRYRGGKRRPKKKPRHKHNKGHKKIRF